MTQQRLGIWNNTSQCIESVLKVVGAYKNQFILHVSTSVDGEMNYITLGKGTNLVKKAKLKQSKHYKLFV